MRSHDGGGFPSASAAPIVSAADAATTSETADRSGDDKCALKSLEWRVDRELGMRGPAEESAVALPSSGLDSTEVARPSKFNTSEVAEPGCFHRLFENCVEATWCPNRTALGAMRRNTATGATKKSDRWLALITVDALLKTHV